MRISRRPCPRKLTTGCLLRYVCVCIIVSVLFFVCSHVALNRQWGWIDFRSEEVLRREERRSANLQRLAWKSSRNFPISGIYKPEWVETVKLKQQPHNLDKSAITFITDDSEDDLINRRRVDRQLKTENSDPFVKINHLDKNFDQPGNYGGLSVTTWPGLSLSNKFKFVGGPILKKLDSFPIKPKVILLWTTFFGKPDWLSNEKFENCTIPGWSSQSSPCVISSNQSDLPISDLIVVHANDLQLAENVPKTRPANQRWLFYCQESPKHMYLNLDNITGAFNYTILTRRDADYVFRHGEAVLKQKPMRRQKYEDKFAQIFALKKRIVVARISNCEPLERLKYIEELREFIDVDFFGACGDKKCPKSDDECNGSKMATYKFYLAFENSRCRDYITEKFWLPLHHWNSVPVVMGGADPGDYTAVAPPHSYINTADFPSPKHLADYLILLDQNHTLYDEYFQWRRYYGNRRQKDGTWCKVCADLHDPSKPVQYYTDIKSWYQQDSCIANSNRG